MSINREEMTNCRDLLVAAFDISVNHELHGLWYQDNASMKM